jgi:alpha-1,2-mannosyltransferase
MSRDVSTLGQGPLRTEFAVLFLALACYSFFGVNNPFRPPREQYDFRIYYLGSMALRMGLPLYDRDMSPGGPPSTLQRVAEEMHLPVETGRYFYPPFYAYATLPLTYLSLPRAGQVWFYLNLVWVMLAAILLWRILARMGGDGISPLLVAGVVLFSPAVNFSVYLGQVNMLVLCLILGSWLLFEWGNPIPGGALLAVAVAIKVTPALLLLYFILNRQWRFVWGAVAMGGALLLFGPMLYYDYFVYAVPGMSQGYAYIADQSLNSFFARLVETSPALLYNDELRPLAGWALLARKAATLLVLAATVWMMRPLGQTPVERFGRFAFVLLAVLLLSKIAWIHHSVLALPAVFACSLLLHERPGERWFRGLYLSGLILLFVPGLLFFSIYLDAPVWTRFFASPYLAGRLALWLCLGLMLQRSRRVSEKSVPANNEKKPGTPLKAARFGGSATLSPSKRGDTSRSAS